MRRYYPYIFLMLSIALLSNCQKDQEPQIDYLEILPLGDSRVEGHPEDFVSYRYELWKLLRERNLDVDFVGSRKDQRSYPRVNDESFDIDHEGKSGDRSDQVLSRVNSLIASGAENVGEVVLLGAGGNDLLQMKSYESALSNLEAIIVALQNANPDVTIFIEQIEDGTTELNNYFQELRPNLEAFNAAIPVLAEEKSTATSKVIVVNMYDLLTDDDYADGVHYNEAGAKKIANEYFKAMDTEIF